MILKLIALVISLSVIFKSGNVLFSPKADRYVVTLDTSQVVVYLGFEGLSFAIPFIKRVTRGCRPTGLPSIQGCIDDIVERRTFTIRYCKLLSIKLVTEESQNVFDIG